MPGPNDSVSWKTRSPTSYPGRGWDLDATLGGSVNWGNLKTADGYAKIDYLMLCWKKGYSLNFIAEGQLKYKDPEIYQLQGRVSGRFDKRIAKPNPANTLWLSVLATLYHDKALGVDYRITAGGGIRLLTLQDGQFDKIKNDLSLFVIPEWENYKDFDQEYFTRLSLRNTSEFPIGDVVVLGFDLFYVPNITDFKDFRADASGSLGLKINQMGKLKDRDIKTDFILGLKSMHRYNSRPPGFPDNSIGPYDTTTLLTFTVKAGQKSDTYKPEK